MSEPTEPTEPSAGDPTTASSPSDPAPADPQPTWGAQPVATAAAPPPPTYSSQSVREMSTAKRRKLGGAVGVLAALAVIAVKFGAAFGLGALWHHSKHEAGDAEKVVQRVMETESDAEITNGLMPGVDPGDVFDASCISLLSAQANESEVLYTIDRSKKNADGSATVTVGFQHDKGHMEVHLLSRDGWRIDHIACD